MVTDEFICIFINLVGGFKKKMKPNASSASKDVEMGVKYQQQGRMSAYKRIRKTSDY